MMAQIGADDLARLRPMSRVFHAIVRGLIKLYLGEFDESHVLMTEAMRTLALVPPQERLDIGGIDAGVVARMQCINACVCMGRLEQADALTLEAIEIARRRNHPPTLTWVLSLQRWMAFRHGDMAESMRLSRERQALSERLGSDSQPGSALMLLGRAMVGSGQVEEGTRLLQEGFAVWAVDGSQTGITEFAAMAADALLAAGRPADAESFVAAGEQALGHIPERFFAAELIRQRALLSRHAGDAAAAEAGLREALAMADRQGARLFALRAATDLARLLNDSARSVEGQAVLRAALEAMPEGLDQPDALRAEALLTGLGTPDTAPP